jgi:hypothetical protein
MLISVDNKALRLWISTDSPKSSKKLYALHNPLPFNTVTNK